MRLNIVYHPFEVDVRVWCKLDYCHRTVCCEATHEGVGVARECVVQTVNSLFAYFFGLTNNEG